MNFISRPGLILNKEKCIDNIKGMFQKAATSGVDFRPHFKTHQSLGVGNWFKEMGVSKITVSSLSMASYFLSGGWNDITVAFPLNLREIDFLDELAGRAEIHQTILSLESAARMENELKNRLNIWVKIDTGAGRTGIAWDDFNRLDELIEFLQKSDKLKFMGFMVHAGHTYRARIREEVEFIYYDSVEKLGILRERYSSLFPNLKVSWGDTPSCSIIENLQGMDEIRPGNFVFYDIMQSIIGSCSEEQIAVALACPVVAKHPERKTIIVYGGGVHLSKDSMILHDGTEIFGKVALPEGNAWGKSLENCYVSSLSQEHGMLKVSNEVFNRVNEGDIVYILPVHSCMTADLMQGYRLLDGTDVDHMSAKIHKSWH
jgi:D-serine deaminase-like pyridoxal phosphate-dependent protein